jgi:hypothetical protein
VEGPAAQPRRIFKTAWFSRASAKSGISDAELCQAIRQVMLGQADDLGGGVFKKRLSKNLSRSIILAKGGQYWIYEYLFAKKDRASITQGELVEFRRLAKIYSTLTRRQVIELLENKAWAEICNDNKI